MRVFHLKTTSLRGRQNVYGYILVGFSFLVLTFLTVKTLAPEIRTEAATQTATQTVGPYTMSMSASDAASINITPTATQAVYTGTNNLTVSNTCDSGATITMKMSGASNALTRTATNGDNLTKTINATNTTGALADNSWGYSTNSGSTYAAVPISTATAATIYNGTTTASNASVPLMFGVKTDNNMPSGTYTGDVVYTMTPKEGCNSYSITWDYAGGTKNSSYNYPTSLSWGATVNLTGSTPTKSGYTFTGWSNGSSSFTDKDTAANLNPTNAKSVTVTAVWKQNCAINCTELNLSQNESVGYEYTGQPVGVTLQKAGYYKLEVWGAQGGGVWASSFDNASTIDGNYENPKAVGTGGYSVGAYQATAGQVIYIYVGGRGNQRNNNKTITASAGGWNGGGEGFVYSSSNEYYGMYTGGGGGATDIRTVYYAVTYQNRAYYTNNTDSLNLRIIVAGGGGGGWFGGGASQHGNCNSPGGGGGSGYIGGVVTYGGITKQMYSYSGPSTGEYPIADCQSSSDVATKTTCVSTSNATATANTPKLGDGYARITYLGN